MILNLESSQFQFTVEPNEAPVSMGREEPCEIVVESSSVSRKHCELTCEDGTWFVKDLGSRYGTTVNGKSATKPTTLGNGDVLKLGSQNFIVSLMASNDMEDLGRHLSGGKVRGLVNAAMQKKPAAAKSPSVRKKKSESPETMMYEKDELANAINKAAADKADAAEKSDGEANENADSKDSEEAEGQAAEVKAAPAGKSAKKNTMRLRAEGKKKKGSPLALMAKLAVLLIALGAAGFFGWKQYQQQQAAAPAAGPGSGETAPAAKLPPKPDSVALPAKPATEEKKPDEPAPAAKPDEKPAAKPDEKPADAKPDEKPADAKPEAKPEPKADEK